MRSKCSALLLLLVGLMMAGCTPPTDPMLEMLDADLGKTKVNDLDRTMDFIFSEVRFSNQEFKENLSNGLNRWVSYSEDRLQDTKWTEDELSKPLFDQHQTLQLLERNDEFSFLNSDAYYLQQAAWVDQVAKRAVATTGTSQFELFRLAADNYRADEDVEDPLFEVMKKLHSDLDDEQAKKLSNSLKVFDWVMRNVQMVTDTTVEEDEVDNLRLNERTENLAAAGVPGLGYKRYPYQLLLYSRGDYVERAKLFMLTLNALNIDSVMFQPQTDDAKPWAVGVAIGENYYLFDTQLALPIPGEKTGTIATLADVRKNGDLLTSLDLTTDESLEDNTDYWVRPDDVKKLDGLIYVTPESISKRMSGLEQSLTGEDRFQVVFHASDVAKRLPEVEGVKKGAWDIGFKTHAFRQAVREALEQTSNNSLLDKVAWYYQEELYIDDFVIYRTARARFLKGKFKTETGARSRNAIESCTRMLYSDQDVSDLGSSEKLQRLLGIRNDEKQDAQSFKKRVSSVQSQMLQIRRDAGMHLVQCLFDTGSVYAAGNWLENLQLEDDVARWDEQIIYLLGRAYEGRKEYDKAIEELSDSKRDQAHGNLIRARLLKSLVDTYYNE
jgi:hypothetical protein